MKIQTFTPITVYKKCPIYIRRMETTFEYLTVIHGELYQHHFEMKPVLYRRLLYHFGLVQRYSQKEIAALVAYVRRAAEATIDTITKSGTKPHTISKRK